MGCRGQARDGGYGGEIKPEGCWPVERFALHLSQGKCRQALRAFDIFPLPSLRWGCHPKPRRIGDLQQVESRWFGERQGLEGLKSIGFVGAPWCNTPLPNQ